MRGKHFYSAFADHPRNFNLEIVTHSKLYNSNLEIKDRSHYRNYFKIEIVGDQTIKYFNSGNCQTESIGIISIYK